MPAIKKLQALVYALIERRASSTAKAVLDNALREKRLAPTAVATLMHDKAVVLEKEGSDLQEAQRA